MRALFESLLALAGLIVCIPLLVVIALAIVLDSPGNPFHLAWRVGKGGRIFRMWKFRTMALGAAAMGPPITGKKDPRVTRVGVFLRRTKLDELPQLLNVLLGDMGLVGPRPETPEIVALYTQDERAVLAVKPGLTGRVQVDVKDEPETIPQDVRADEYYVRHLLRRKLRRDLDYLKNRSLLTDVRILMATAMYVSRSVIGCNESATNKKALTEE